MELCLRALPVAFDFVERQLAEGRVTVVHCSSGKDRTGLFLGYYLIRNAGLSPTAAIEEVQRVRPIALSAPGWKEFALDVLCSIAKNRAVDEEDQDSWMFRDRSEAK